MHADQITVTTSLVHKLLHSQFPDLAMLPLKKVHSTGTGHAIYRLGSKMCVRLPVTEDTQLQIEKEWVWLPKLAPKLPLQIPIPIRHGQPEPELFPFTWAIYSWLDGENATRDGLADETQAALDLAGFVSVLRGIDPVGGPRPGKHNFYRGVPLSYRDRDVRMCVQQCNGLINSNMVLEAWEESLLAPEWDKDPVWIHGDIHSGNLLTVDGQISAVIDFGGLGVGDPACDLLMAWWLFSAPGRAVFKEALGVDDATWRRGRGWALSMAVIALPYYIESNPVFANEAKRAITEVLSE